MKKIKNQKIKTYALYGAIVLIAVIAIGSISYAYTSFGNGVPKVVVEGNYIEGTTNAPAVETLGSVSSPTLESPYFCVNRDCVYHVTGDFIDASTTIVSFVNPFGEATSTLEMMRLEITGAATTTYTVACGASADMDTANSYSILSSDSISTSTTGVVENGIATAYNLGAGGGSIQKIMLTPTYHHVVCIVTTSAAAYNNAFTNAVNTFTGKFTARISQTLR